MQLNLTKEQLREMLLASMIYSWIYGGVAEDRGEDWQKYEKLQKYLLQVAKENGFDDLVEEFHGRLVPTDKLCELEQEVIYEYNDDEFWHQLATRLGQRDFKRDMTSDEEWESKKNGWLPERVHEFYDKYNQEFEEYGVDRLDIKKE